MDKEKKLNATKLDQLLDELHEEKLSLEHATQEARRDLEATQAALRGAREELESIQSTLVRLAGEKRQAEVEVTRAQAEARLLDERAGYLAEKNTEMQRALRTADEHLRMAEQRKLNAEAAIGEADRAVAARRAEAVRVQEEIAAIDQQRAGLLKEIENIKTERAREQAALDARVAERVGIVLREQDLLSRELYIKELYERAGVKI